MKYLVYAVNGKILRYGQCQPETLALQAGANEVAIETSADITEHHYIDEGVLAQKPTKPSPHHIFDYTTKQWVDTRTLEDLKATKNAAINAARLQANQSNFTYDGHQISCDALSRSDIDGVNGIVALTGNLPVDWVGFWKTADNAYISILDVATWANLYAAMVAQGQANFLHSQNLKSQLQAATTIEEVEAIPNW